MKRKRKMLLMVLSSVLLFLLLFALSSCGGRENSTGGPGISAKPEGGESGAEVTISLDKTIENLNESYSMWEFSQRLFQDVIIYKNSAGRFTYEPVNAELPLCGHDWDNLVRLPKLHREFEYVEDGEKKSMKGIDVSHYQGEIDWEKVAGDGVEFAFIRLGYRGYETGKLAMDKSFENNIKGALKNGVAVGVYFVTQAMSKEEAAEEADFVLDAIAPYDVTWPVVLDIEAAGGKARTDGLGAEERTDFAVAFCERIKEKGRTPMLYCAVRWFVEELSLERLTDYEKWFAQYFNRPYFPYDFDVWQYTNSGRVAGIKGNVDLNLSMRDFGKDGK